MSPAEETLPTFGNEDTLPRVPLPTLEDSCGRFLEWCAPLLTDDELAATDSAVAEMLRPDGPGRRLQAALQDYDDTPGVHSWLDTFWPSRYLGRRDRIAVNANFFFLFEPSRKGRVERAAGLVAAAVGYKLRLDEEQIPPAVQLPQGRRQSMEQYRYLFSTTRIPGPVQDTVRSPYSEQWPGPSRERHIVVMHRGHMFRLEVLGPQGVPYALDELVAALQAIMAAGATPAPDGTAIGSLTSAARARWAADRDALLAGSPHNAAALDNVETALFCLSLDDVTPADVHEAGDQLLHGDSGNRWFDKPLVFVVFADGTAGVNVEHARLDGTTILALVDALLGEPAEEQSRRSGARSQGLPDFSELTFELDADLQDEVRAAAASFAAYAADTATLPVAFEGFGARQIKQLRMSPDAFVQMAYQLAHQRTKGRIGATYESIATRHFAHGRTEAMRVVTPEVLAFLVAMSDPAADAATRVAALRAAAAKHVARAMECQAGNAPEQHLWELQLIQQRRGADLGVPEAPALYASPGWQVMREDYLSTSSAPSAHIQYFGFGSTSARCIGIAYVLLPDDFHLYLSTPRAVAGHLPVFAERLRETVAELQELLRDDATEPASGCRGEAG